MNAILLFLLTIVMPFAASANNAAPVGIGGAAKEFIEPVSIATDFVRTGSIIIGVIVLCSALMRYMQYRVNPLAAPLGGVIALLILGLALLGLPFIYLLIY